jgi:hypothetical protein
VCVWFLEYPNTWSCCLKTKMTVRGSWLTNAPFCFCFSFPSSLIFGPFFFLLYFFLPLFVFSGLWLCLCFLCYVLFAFTPLFSFPWFFLCSPLGFSSDFFSGLCSLPPSRSLSIYSLSILSFLVCVSVPLPFFLSFSLACLHVTEFFCSL